MFVLGCDVSRGYVDITVVNERGELALPPFQADASAQGESRIFRQISALRKNYPQETVIAVMENTGGYEANIAQCFRQHGVPVSVLNPKNIHSFRQLELHHAITDPSSARDIALFALQHLDAIKTEVEGTSERALKRLAHILDALSRDMTRLKNRLDNLLFTVRPELLSLTRGDKPRWLLQLLLQYPIPQKLARGRMSRVTRIPSITPDKARNLISLAKSSRGADNHPDFAPLIVYLATRLLQAMDQEKTLRKELEQRFNRIHPSCPLPTIKGVSSYGAAIILAHIGNVHRFHSAKALVAFFGLDPLVRESGDLQHRRHISKRGPGMVRRVLYMQCLSMCSDPDHPIGRFYARLTKQGKPHYYAITACMRKLTVILYAMLRSGNAFDPNYEDSSKALKQSERDRGRKKLRVAKHARTSLALDVPISTREAKRRKRIIALQNKKREGPHVSCDTSAGSCPKNLNEVTFPWYNVALS